MLKITVFLILTLIIGHSVYGQDRKMQRLSPYVLTGEIVKVRQDCNVDTQREFRLELAIHHRLQNTSDDDLLLWKGEDGDFLPMYIGQTVSTSEGFEKPTLIYDRIGGESVALGPKWENLRKQLDAAAPPSDAVLFIKPKEFVEFESRVFLLARTPFRGMTGGVIDLDRLKELDAVWLRTKFQVWSQNLNPRKKVQKGSLFSEILKERWRPFGFLLLDNIVSEPMYIELSMPGSQRGCS